MSIKYNPDVHHRCYIRLKGYDYSQAGLYFITICTQNQLCLFGEVENGNMQSNVAGKMVKQQWQGLVHRFNTIKLHEFIVMPNHFHGIIELVGVPLVGTQNNGSTHFVKQPQTEQPQMGQLSIMGQQNVGVPLVGTQNDGSTHFVKQSQTEQPQTGQLSIMGQPQGILQLHLVMWLGRLNHYLLMNISKTLNKTIGNHSIKNCGNAIITNTLFVMKVPIIRYQNIYKPTL